MPRKTDQYTHGQFQVAGDSFECKHCKKKMKGTALMRRRVHLSKCEPYKQETGLVQFAQKLREWKLSSTEEDASSKAQAKKGGLFQNASIAPKDSSGRQLNAANPSVRASPFVSPPSMRKHNKHARDVASGGWQTWSKRHRRASSISGSSAGGSVESVAMVKLQSAEERLSDHEADALSFALAKFVHLSGLSFDTFATRSGKDLVEALRPAYADKGIVSAEDIGGTFLVRHDDAVRNRSREQLAGISVGISMAGWAATDQALSEEQASRPLNLMVCKPFPLLLRHFQPQPDQDDVQNLGAALKFALEEIKGINGNDALPPVVGVCSDSPATHRVVRGLVGRVEAGLVAYGCACHTLGKHIQDLAQFGCIDKVLEQVSAASWVFSHVGSARDALRAAQLAEYGSLRKLPAFDVSRGDGIFLALRAIVRNKSALLHVLAKCKTDPQFRAELDLESQYGPNSTNKAGMNGEPVHVAALLDDRAFWRRAEACAQLFAPTYFWIQRLKVDGAAISLVPAAFLQLFRLYKALSATPSNAQARSAADQSHAELLESLRLGPDLFDDSIEDPAQTQRGDTAPSLLRKRWCELAGYSSKTSSRSSMMSNIFQLALTLDPLTLPFRELAEDEGLFLDDTKGIGAHAMEGLYFVMQRLGLEEGSAAWGGMKGELIAKLVQIGASKAGSASALESPFVHAATTDWRLKKVILVVFRLPASAAAGDDALRNVVGSSAEAQASGALSPAQAEVLARIRFNTTQLNKDGSAVEGGGRTEELRARLYSAHVDSFPVM